MGISATTAGYTNTGHDLHLVMIAANGSQIAIENIMSFDARQETQDITRVRLDNRVLLADLPRNWSGTITYDRGTGAADVAIANIENNWFAGNDYTLGSFVITVSGSVGLASNNAASLTTATTANGANTAVTTITFYDVTLRQEDSGTWRGDDATSARLAFRAARRAVSGAGAITMSAALNQN